MTVWFHAYLPVFFHEHTELTMMAVLLSQALLCETKKIQQQNITSVSIEPGYEPFRPNASP